MFTFLTLQAMGVSFFKGSFKGTGRGQPFLLFKIPETDLNLQAQFVKLPKGTWQMALTL